MIPVRASSIFKSRWMALAWAAGIVWLAIRLAGSDGTGNADPPPDLTGATISNEDLEKFADFANAR